MLSKRIQDFAGENSLVVRFIRLTLPIYVTLTYEYDEDGKLSILVYENRIAYNGQKRDSIEHLYISGTYWLVQYEYGKAGNLWKIKSTHYRDGERWFEEQKVGRKFQRTDDVYENGLLKERRFIGEKQKQSFYHSPDYFMQGDIYFEWQDEREDVVVRIAERYDEAHRLISQHNFEAKLSNPADIRTDELLCFHYRGRNSDTVTQIDRISTTACNEYLKATTLFEKELFSDFDEKGSWQTASFYKYDQLGGEEKLTHSKRREIAYNEASAYELKAKFESLVAEFYAATDEARQVDLMDQLITALDLEEDK